MCQFLALFFALILSVVFSGYRSVPLKNSYSEELELASLLVHIEIVNAKVVYPFLQPCSSLGLCDTIEISYLSKENWRQTRSLQAHIGVLLGARTEGIMDITCKFYLTSAAKTKGLD